MKFDATLIITPLELKHIIEDYLDRNNVHGISDQHIHFLVEEVERGSQRDPWKVHELTQVRITNVDEEFGVDLEDADETLLLDINRRYCEEIENTISYGAEEVSEEEYREWAEGE